LVQFGAVAVAEYATHVSAICEYANLLPTCHYNADMSVT
jgi:hypothetical protein